MVKKLLIFIIIFPYLVSRVACAQAVEMAPINSTKNNNIFVESSSNKNNPYVPPTYDELQQMYKCINSQ